MELGVCIRDGNVVRFGLAKSEKKRKGTKSEKGQKRKGTVPFEKRKGTVPFGSGAFPECLFGQVPSWTHLPQASHPPHLAHCLQIAR